MEDCAPLEVCRETMSSANSAAGPGRAASASGPATAPSDVLAAASIDAISRDGSTSAAGLSRRCLSPNGYGATSSTHMDTSTKTDAERNTSTTTDT